MLVDQKLNDGIPVPFFGRPAMTAPALAQMALASGDRDEARAQLEPLLTRPVDADICRLMAELEERSGRSQEASDWLRRAASAPGSAGWYCSACGHREDDWSLHCPSCGTLDSLGWHRPAGSGVPALVAEPPAAVSAELVDDDDAERPGEHEKVHLGDIAPTATRG